MPSEPKGVTEGSIDCFLLGFVEGKIEFRVKFGIVSKVIDSWGNHISRYCHYARKCFKGSGCAKAMAGHALGRADI